MAREYFLLYPFSSWAPLLALYLPSPNIILDLPSDTLPKSLELNLALSPSIISSCPSGMRIQLAASGQRGASLSILEIILCPRLLQESFLVFRGVWSEVSHRQKYQEEQRLKAKGCDRCRLCHGEDTRGLQVNDLMYLGLHHHPHHHYPGGHMTVGHKWGKQFYQQPITRWQSSDKAAFPSEGHSHELAEGQAKSGIPFMTAT